VGDVISVLSKANKADIRTEPFPHIVVGDALPQDLFDELIGSFPKTETIVGSRALDSNKLFLLSARKVAETDVISKIWREFFDYHTSQAFFLDVIELWQDFILDAYPDIEADLGKTLRDFTTGIRHSKGPNNPANLAEDIQLDCQFGINSAVDNPSSVRGPHTDGRYKLVAGLLYFRDPEDDSTGGELELFRFRDPNLRYHRGTAVDRRFVENLPVRRLMRIASRHVEQVASIPYAANVLVMWLNTPYAIHGVSPRQPTPWSRKYVNLLGEVYRGHREGFFQIDRPRRHFWPFSKAAKPNSRRN